MRVPVQLNEGGFPMLPPDIFVCQTLLTTLALRL